jgi:DNA repair photolyase
MALNKSKGNMYEFVTHTWNTIKGICPHDCTYCYMKRWGNLRQTRLDESELKTNLGNGNFIFVGSSCDIFANDIPYEWVKATLDHCRKFDNKYLFQTKNPSALLDLHFCLDAVFCTTIETNRWYPDIMKNSPSPEARAICMSMLSGYKYVTIEPIIDFDLPELVEFIKMCKPKQVNIGADSGGNGLPEPDIDKVKKLIGELAKFTIIAKKQNLGRLMKSPPNKAHAVDAEQAHLITQD